MCKIKQDEFERMSTKIASLEFRIKNFEQSGLGLKRDNIVELKNHNPKWKNIFKFEKDLIKQKLGIDSLQLYHCGSTSISHICAKPILDILGVVDDLNTFDAKKDILEQLGYECKGEYGLAGRRYCVLYSPDKKVGYVHLHVYQNGHLAIDQHLAFCTYLREHKSEAMQYQQLKLKLKSLPRDEYTPAKSEFINSLLKKISQSKEYCFLSKAEEQASWNICLPELILEKLKNVTFPWWIAGGYALQLFAWRQYREHSDIDILLLRKNLSELKKIFQEYEFYLADPAGKLRWWGESPIPQRVHDIWVKKSGQAHWNFQLMVVDSDEENHLYKRNMEVKFNIKESTYFSKLGIPFLAPEIQLFCKAKNVRLKDQIDFDECVKSFSTMQKKWLRYIISKHISVSHSWIELL